MNYVGRFAPSPTGPLHFGSLVAAVASYLDARSKHGKWLVRIEDLDKPREVAGASNSILRTLEAFGFEWDNHVMYQSQRNEDYTNALTILKNHQLIYSCTCTRKEIADSSVQTGTEGVIYPQTCLKHPIKENHAIAWRVKTEDKTLSFEDAIQGNLSQNLKFDIGDFILKRADGLYAYQLAVVVDDAAQGVTHVVRGADLLPSTIRQIYLQTLLKVNTPSYMHIPVVVNAQGQKLSKQSLALALNAKDATQQLWEAFRFLNQNPPEGLKHSDLKTSWEWAISQWDFKQIPKLISIPVEN
jgi:glutamyl-Q tRNA(Asp) synthetase